MSPDRSPRVSEGRLRQFFDDNEVVFAQVPIAVLLAWDLRDSRARIAELEAALEVAEKALRQAEAALHGSDFRTEDLIDHALARIAALRPETEKPT